MTTQDRGQYCPPERASAILRGICDLHAVQPLSDHAGAHLLARELAAHLEGRIGWQDVAHNSDDAAAREEAARAFANLDRPADAFALLVGLDPRQHSGVLGTAIRVLPHIDPAALFAQLRWIALLFPALLDSTFRKDVDALVHAMHQHCHFELVGALRRSRLGEIIEPDSWRLIDAREACWAGRYCEVESLLAGGSLSGTHRLEADLHLAVAHSNLGSHPSDTEMRALAERAKGISALDEAIERWRAEILVRAECTDRRLVSRTLARASDHAALCLLVRIADGDAPRREPAQDPIRGFHTYVLETLRDAGVLEAQAALDAADGVDEEGALWRVLERLGGNRSDSCTRIDDGRVRPLSLRTARQEAVASQALLPALGPEAVMSRLAALASRHPELSVFATYQAEILLWQGRYDEAAARFETEVRRAATRWGEVGLGAALAGLGNEAEAERVWERGHQRHHGALAGEATFVYRAEIAARRGDLRAARTMLDGVLAAKRTRMRGWLLRAEIDWIQRDDRPAREALLQALALCPALAVTVTDPGNGSVTLLLEDRPPSAGERDTLIAWCQALRQALGGNASSWLYTWLDATGTLRAFKHVPPSDVMLALEATERIARRAERGSEFQGDRANDRRGR